MLRVWTGKEDIRAITKTARTFVGYASLKIYFGIANKTSLFNFSDFFPLHSLKLLSVTEAIYLEDEFDNIEKTLSLSLLDSKGGADHLTLSSQALGMRFQQQKL
ncbi:hypothetical protein ACH5RR_024867 [Cinchona calisaya]|uniref:Uncharacterized protein n=1 Tax=Cinchona calisaya TaxID=153742 RepID=A0ABD2YXZ8_9GENT